MTDRELLELAAKAAGLKLDVSGTNGGRKGQGFDVMGNAVLDWHNGETWNPLIDDGHALQLAVKLHIDVNHQKALDVVEAFWSKVSGCKREPYGSDRWAATRRAIVRAAAEIGKGM